MTRSDPGQRYAGRAGEPAEERSYDAACEELHQQAIAEARERHPVRRLSARWKPLPCEPPGEPLSAKEKDLLQGIWLGLEAYPLAEEPRPEEKR
jgi:hypothetical protein